MNLVGFEREEPYEIEKHKKDETKKEDRNKED